MAVKPTINKLNWIQADTDAYTEPSGSKKASGYAPFEPLPAQHLNWFLRSLSLWIDYLDASVSNEIEPAAGAVTVDDTDQGKLFLVNSTAGAFNFILPNPAVNAGLRFRIRDVGGKLSTNPITLQRFASEGISGLAANYLLESDFGTWEVVCDGTNYYLL